jgi:predicted enzyme related to lactoylglutathione lyase
MHRSARTRFFAALQALLGVLLLAGCASQSPQLPVIGTPGTSLPGKVVWHDLVTPDLERSRTFYADLFGWRFEELSNGYLLARNEGRPVAGLARLDSGQRTSHWLPLLSVTDIAQAQETTRSADGKVVLKAFELRGRGQIAVLKDPQGAAFGVLQSSHGDPEDRVPGLNAWMWNELWTDDLAGAAAYYEKLFGYEQGSAIIGAMTYDYFKRDGKPRAGLLTKPDPQIGNTWLCYLRVDDVAAVTDKARALGGTVLMAPNSKVRNGSVAILADPNGAGFVVQEWRK